MSKYLKRDEFYGLIFIILFLLAYTVLILSAGISLEKSSCENIVSADQKTSWLECPNN